MSSDKTRVSHAPGWLPRPVGSTRPPRGKYPMKVAVPMTEDMVAFLDIHADELGHLMQSKVTRAALVREAISRIAWDHFGIDVE